MNVEITYLVLQTHTHARAENRKRKLRGANKVKQEKLPGKSISGGNCPVGVDKKRN